MSGGLSDAALGVQGGQLARGSAEPKGAAFPRQGSSSHDTVIPRQTTRRDASLPVSALGTSPSVAIGAVTDGRSGVRPYSLWLRAWGLHVEAVLAFCAGAFAAFAADPRPYVALMALGIWMLGSYHGGRALTTPLTRQLKTVGQSALLPLAMVAAGVGFLHLPATTVPQAFGALGAGALVSILCRSVRWRLQAPIRVVVVGDRAAIATATARWARTPAVSVVGGLLVEPDLADGAAPQEILGVPTVTGMGSVKSLVRHRQADLVVVHAGEGVTPDAFRRLTWALEGSPVSIGVSGVLDAVAPHRITPGGLGRSAIMDVRPPRPSKLIRGLKGAGDRLAGLVLLVAISPLLLAMVVAVRLDSKGPAFFTQTRVGRGGVPFKVFKMRTMVQEAEQIKANLFEVNEFDSVLFKMKRDPRVTRVGHFLRTSSLDELPQLINVVRGEMSLVGPRPFLPDEVARMDEDTLRRHAVQPGITGLWQVSGRSDLAWDESAALDTYYADNWTLGGDIAIALRTVNAVIGGKGAY